MKVQLDFVRGDSALSVGRSACSGCAQQSSALFLQELEWSVVGKLGLEVSRRFILVWLVKQLIVSPLFRSETLSALVPRLRKGGRIVPVVGLASCEPSV